MPNSPGGIGGPDPFKLRIFCYNVEGGVALTTVPERWQGRRDDMVAAVQVAELWWRARLVAREACIS